MFGNTWLIKKMRLQFEKIVKKMDLQKVTNLYNMKKYTVKNLATLENK